MTDDNKWKYVSATLEKLKQFDDTHTEALDGLMVAPESPLVEPFAYVCELVVDGLETLVGDAFSSISWFVYECDFGDDAKSAGISPDMRLIKTTEDLRWLVELDNENK